MSWSPDGARIAYAVSEAGDKPSVYVVGVDDSVPARRIAAGRDPSWSADGASIAFAR